MMPLLLLKRYAAVIDLNAYYLSSPWLTLRQSSVWAKILATGVPSKIINCFYAIADLINVGFRCEKAVAADKQILVKVAPPILVLSLKRFNFITGMRNPRRLIGSC